MYKCQDQDTAKSVWRGTSLDKRGYYHNIQPNYHTYQYKHSQAIA